MRWRSGVASARTHALTHSNTHPQTRARELLRPRLCMCFYFYYRDSATSDFLFEITKRHFQFRIFFCIFYFLFSPILNETEITGLRVGACGHWAACSCSCARIPRALSAEPKVREGWRIPRRFKRGKRREAEQCDKAFRFARRDAPSTQQRQGRRERTSALRGVAPHV